MKEPTKRLFQKQGKEQRSAEIFAKTGVEDSATSTDGVRVSQIIKKGGLRDPAHDEAVGALRQEVGDVRRDLSSLQESVRGVENSVADIHALLLGLKQNIADSVASATVAAVTEQDRSAGNRDRSRTRDRSPGRRTGGGRGGDGSRGDGGGKGLDRKGRDRAGSAGPARSSPIPKRHPQSPRAHA